MTGTYRAIGVWVQAIRMYTNNVRLYWVHLTPTQLMKGVISFKQMKDLQRKVLYLCENDGIYNQIDHLHRPDDNEVFDYVFDYLEIEIQKVIESWKDIKTEIMKVKNKLIKKE